MKEDTHELAKFFGEVVRDYPKLVAYFIGVFISAIGVLMLEGFAWTVIFVGDAFVLAAFIKGVMEI